MLRQKNFFFCEKNIKLFVYLSEYFFDEQMKLLIS